MGVLLDHGEKIFWQESLKVIKKGMKVEKEKKGEDKKREFTVSDVNEGDGEAVLDEATTDVGLLYSAHKEGKEESEEEGVGDVDEVTDS